VFFLSGGGAYAHADARRTTVAAAAAWAREVGLAGLVLEAGAAQAHAADVAAARRGPASLQACCGGRRASWRCWMFRQHRVWACYLLTSRLNRASGRRMLCARRAPSQERVCAAAGLHCQMYRPALQGQTQFYMAEVMRSRIGVG